MSNSRAAAAYSVYTAGLCELDDNATGAGDAAVAIPTSRKDARGRRLPFSNTSKSSALSPVTACWVLLSTTTALTSTVRTKDRKSGDRWLLSCAANPMHSTAAESPRPVMGSC